MKPVKNAFITLPNQEKIPVKFAGTVKVTPNLILEDVLYVPQFKFNLMFMSSLPRNSHVEVRCLTDSCFVQDLHNKMMIGRGERLADLYILNDSTTDVTQSHCRSLLQNACVSVSSSVNNVNAHVWHHRLGHLSFQKLKLLKDQLHMLCNKDGSHMSIPYDICPLAKQRRLSFTSHNHISPNAFDLIHCDTWGLYHVPTLWI